MSCKATQVNGAAGPMISSKVQVRAAPQRLSVKPVEVRVPADGRSTVTIQGQLLDADGNRSNRDATVTLSTSAGEFIGLDAAEDQPGFQVQARQGEFTASLRGLDAQTVRVQTATGAPTIEAFTQIDIQGMLAEKARERLQQTES